jgi:hypothetical protein
MDNWHFDFWKYLCCRRQPVMPIDEFQIIAFNFLRYFSFDFPFSLRAPHTPA